MTEYYGKDSEAREWAEALGADLTTPDEEWMNGWSLKLLGYVRMAREVLPHMQRQGCGRIINVVGAAARNPVVTYMMGGGVPMPRSSTSPRPCPIWPSSRVSS